MTIEAVDRPRVDPLVTVNAAAELAELRRLRAVVTAAAAGRTQADIAARLDVSQPAVHKMLVRARHKRDLMIETPWEVALRYAAGEIDRGEMLATFTAWPWTTDQVLDLDVDPLSEAFIRGSWSDLVKAADRGYISDDDYQVIFDRTTA